MIASAAVIALAVTMYLTWRDPLFLDDRSTRVLATAAWLLTALALLVLGQDSNAAPARFAPGVDLAVVHLLVWIASLGRPALLMDELLGDELPAPLLRRVRRGQAVLIVGLIGYAIVVTSP